MEYLSSYPLPYQHQQGSKHQPLQRMDCSWRLIWTSRDKLESRKPRGKRRQRMDQSSPKPESVKPTMTQKPQKSGMSISLIRNRTKYNMAWRENVYSRRPQVPECIYQLDWITLRYPIGWIPACSKQKLNNNLWKSGQISAPHSKSGMLHPTERVGCTIVCFATASRNSLLHCIQERNAAKPLQVWVHINNNNNDKLYSYRFENCIGKASLGILKCEATSKLFGTKKVHLKPLAT